MLSVDQPMTQYVDDQLLATLRDLESDRVERKRTAGDRSARDLAFDLRPVPSAVLGDLDYFRSQYLPRAVAIDVLEQNRRAIGERLTSLRLVFDGRPSFGALMVLGRDPQRWVPGAWIQFLRIDGTSITDPIRSQRRLTGRLEDVLRMMDELLEINISVRTSVSSSPTEVRRPDYPLPALQQLARNAIMHRTYEATNAPVGVYWHSDRIEIQNPGGLYRRVNRQNLGQGATDYRNPLVAEAMHHLGYAQNFGLGIPLARDALEKNGNPPLEFDVQPTGVLVNVRPAP